MQRKIRVLVGKPGLDGHDRGAKVVAAALRDAGMEVIYTGLHQTPAQIVEAAMQEDVDVVALSILSGAHMTLFPEVMKQMRARGIGDRLLTGGGIIPAEDMATLAKAGVGRLFGPGASTQDIAQYIREWFEGRRGAGAGRRVRHPGPEGGPAPKAAAAKSGPRPASGRGTTRWQKPKPARKTARARKPSRKRQPEPKRKRR
jgi:methylmalonyl-CoA mutase C-terminal domain/subunit